MKKLFLVAAVALGLGVFTSCNNGSCKSEAQDPQIDTLTAVFGEMYGYGVGSELASDSTFDKKAFLAGLQSVIAMDDDNEAYVQGMQMGMQVKNMLTQIKERENIDMKAKAWYRSFKKAFMSDSMVNPALLQPKVMTLMNSIKAKAKESDPKAIANKKNEEKYIADSLANNPDVKKSEGGVYYKVVKEGKGEKFKKTDRIMVKYAGRHLNGEEFDSSKGEAVPFNPAQVVPGFGEMLLLMNPGAVYTIYIPAELAYGLNGQAPVIEPNEMLIFEVETVGLEK